jgi:hypothetical protein
MIRYILSYGVSMDIQYRALAKPPADDTEVVPPFEGASGFSVGFY